MKKQVYEIDENGYIVEIYVKEFDEQGNCLDELEINIVTIQPQDSLYRSKWNGIEWIEDMTQEEIDALNNVIQEPTTEERLAAIEEVMMMLI